MTMKRLVAIVLAFGLLGAAGCEQKSGTAPGTDPNKPKKLTLTVPNTSHTITQDQTDEVLVNINRDHFNDPVMITVSDLPPGVSLETKDLTIPPDKNNITLTLRAARDAKLVTDHTFHISAAAGDVKTDAPANVKLTVKAK
jgi:hypothetical protein